MSSPADGPFTHTGWTRVRTVLNWINLSTPLGLAVARLGGATIARRGRGTYVAWDHGWRFPPAGAFTIGSVIISRHDRAYLLERPALLRHEDQHCTQYAFVLGVVMLPVYGACAGLSWLVAGDHASYNPFERLAGLADGSYPPPRTRLSRRCRHPARRLISRSGPSGHIVRRARTLGALITRGTGTRPYDAPATSRHRPGAHSVPDDSRPGKDERSLP